MYHKRFWGKLPEHDLGSWPRLGGTFTSAPAAIAWAGSRIDVFGVGMDHAMYTKTCLAETFTPEWRRLGGAFTSAASLVSRGPKRLDLFARGADFTLRTNHTDGVTWSTFQNLGGSLASPPVAVSWGPDRMDVFAVFKDGALWHRWWDGRLWNEWESLGGNYTGEPAAVAWAPGRLDVFVVGAEDRPQDRDLHHHWFSDESWSIPEKLLIGSLAGLAESPTVISPASDRLEIFVPLNNHQIRIGKWGGQKWEFSSAGVTTLRAPSQYQISVDEVHAITTRALDDDTDAAMISVAAGNAPARIKTQSIGTIGGFTTPKTSQTNLLKIDRVTVDLAEPMSFSYLVVNNGHADEDKVLAALAAAGNSLSLAGSSSMQDDIARGVVKFISIKLVAALNLSVPVLGSILGKIESWLLDQLSDAIFESCDGVVAVELRAMMGRDLFIMTDNGKKKVQVTTRHNGTDSPSTCGNNSKYDVTWTIRPL
jgi:hypothetical protein